MCAMTRACVRAILSAVAVLALAASACASDWPNRSVSILVPTAAGGNTDLMARLAAEHLAKTFGQPFVVQNRPSAGGALTSGQVGSAEPDGYTLLFAPNAVTLLAPLVQAMPFDPAEQLVPVTNVGTGAQVLAVRRSLPVATLTEFFTYAKANPGKLNFATAGVNNISHLGPVLLFKRVGVDLVMVATRGEPQAVTDLMAGTVDFYFGNASVLLNADLEKIRILAAGTSKRLAAAPEIPTIAETVPGFVFQSWNGFFVPRSTPDEIVVRLRDAVAEMVRAPQMQQRLTGLGIVPGGQSKDEVSAAFEADRESFGEAVKAAGVKKP